MRNNRRFLIPVAAVFVLGTFVRIAIIRGEDARKPPAGTLEVSIASPRGEIPVLHSIDVVFDSPMVPLGVRGEGKGPVPLVIEPAPAGGFTWIGTRALSFVPRGEIAPGRVITCRIPKGVRSLDGKETAFEFTWRIVVARPRLIASVPGSGGAIASNEPVYLLFSVPPGDGAADSVRLAGPSGEIRLARIEADSSAVTELIPREWRGRLGPANILALRPEGAMTAGASYRIEVAAGIPFAGSSVSLATSVTVAFQTFGEPRPVAASADVFGFNLTLAGPVDPESLRAYLTIRPSIGSFSIRPESGTNLRIEKGRIRGGTAYTLRLKAGLPSLLGERLSAPRTIPVSTPHRDPRLSILPGDGYVPFEKGVAIRIEGLNVDSVAVSGGWIPPDRVPPLVARGYGAGDIPKDLPRIATWCEPRATPESTRVAQIPIERFGPRPAGTRALAIRVTGRTLFALLDRSRPMLGDNAFIQITDLGLATFVGGAGGVAWATRLSTGEPIEGATVSIEAVDGDENPTPGRATRKGPLWSGRTDAEGLVKVPPFGGISLPPGTETIASIRTAEDAAWLRMPFDRNGSSEDGADAAGTTIFTFNDRPLYRPGETVHWVSMARRPTHAGLEPAPLPGAVYHVMGPDGRQIDSGTILFATPGDGSGSFAIPAAAPLGSYSITFSATSDESAPRIGFKGFMVEEYRLPRFQARVSVPTETVISGTKIEAEGRFAYLNGGPLAGSPVVWTITRRNDWSRPEGYYDFSFEDTRAEELDESRGMLRLASGEGQLDSDGGIRVPITPDLTGLGQDKRYLIEIGARDMTDRSAYATADFAVHRAAVRVGARARLVQSVPAESARAISFSAVCVDSAGKPIPDVALRYEIGKRQWKTVRIRRIGGIYGYENAAVDSSAETGEIRSGITPMTLRWLPRGAGLYTFLITARDAAGRVTRARDEVYVSGAETAEWYRNDHDWLDLKPDRKSYDPGDTARVLIPAPAIPTEGLLIVSDNGVREVRRLPHVTGSPAVAVPLGGVFPPGAWLQAVLIGPPSVPQGMPVLRRLPYHGWGTVHLDVQPDDWKIHVEVATDRPAYRPGDEVVVLIGLRDAHGKPIAGTATLAVVDDAIFELVDFGEPDPIETFYGYRGQGYTYADVRNDLKLASRGDKGSLSPGGDGAEGGAGLRRRFLPTVHWEPLVPVGADGVAKIRFRLGDDLTRLRYRVLASSGTDRFGYGEAKAAVTKPLQIEWATPRFVREGDRVDAAAVVRGDFAKPTGVRVRAKTRGARIEGKSEAKVEVGPAENGRAVFRFSEARREGVTFTVRAEGGGETDGISTPIPFDRPLLFDREFVAGRAEPEYTSPIVTTGTAIPDTGRLEAIVSPSMLSGLDDALSSVIDYPYGCLEQLSSVLLSLATQRSLEAHLGSPAGPDSSDRARQLTRAVRQMQSAVEPWVVHSWPSTDSPPASDYTTGYALYAVTRAREEGLAVPRSIADGLSDEVDRRLQRLFEQAPPQASPLLDEGPWLLWAQSEADRHRPADSTRVRISNATALWSRAARSALESRMILAIAIANLRARPDAAELRGRWPEISSSLLQEIRSRDLMRTARFVWIHEIDPEWGDGIGDNARATALYLRFLAAADAKDADLPMVSAWLLNERRAESGAWMNEHVTAIALDAAVAVASAIEGPPMSVAGSLSIGSRVTPFSFAAGSGSGAAGRGGRAPVRVSIPWRDLAGKEGITLRLMTDGGGPAYVAATLDRARDALDSPAREEGVIVARGYVDSKGVDLGDRVPLGAPLFVHLAVVVSRDAKVLLIEDPLPGGIEAVNLRFANAPGVSTSVEPGASSGGNGTERGPDSEGEDAAGRLQIVHSEMGDRSVRLFAQDVGAGIYHVYYPAIATTGGVYKVPGARAEMLYSPEIYGISEPRTITIERKER